MESIHNLRRLSVVIPVWNEALNLPLLGKRLEEVASRLPGWAMTVLIVDDGSTDGTGEWIRAERNQGREWGYLRLSKNWGQSAALWAGLERAAGDAVITMDGDLQHPPELIPSLVAAFEQGADVVQMIRKSPAGGTKGVWSRLFYAVFKHCAGTVPVVPDAADFRLVSRRVLDTLRRIPERDKFLRGLIPMLGFPQVNLTFEEQTRGSGQSGYSFWKSFQLADQALFQFSTWPLRMVFWVGLLLALISFGFGVGHVGVKLIAWQSVTPGFTDLIASILFLSGCILALIGVVSRYLVLILEQVRGRPGSVVLEERPGKPLPGEEKKDGV